MLGHLQVFHDIMTLKFIVLALTTKIINEHVLIGLIFVISWPPLWTMFRTMFVYPCPRVLHPLEWAFLLSSDHVCLFYRLTSFLGTLQSLIFCLKTFLPITSFYVILFSFKSFTHFFLSPWFALEHANLYQHSFFQPVVIHGEHMTKECQSPFPDGLLLSFQSELQRFLCVLHYSPHTVRRIFCTK